MSENHLTFDKGCQRLERICIISSEAADDAWGPYSEEMAAKILPICQAAGYPDAEVVAKELDESTVQLCAGLLPYQIRVDIEGGELQLPATVSLTWPPAEQEGIQEGTPEYSRYFVWAKNERDALLRLARINRSSPPKAMEAEA